MSVFSKILGKLGIGNKKEEESKAPTKPASSQPKRPTYERNTPAENAAVQRAGTSRGDMEMVDVVSKMEAMAKSNPQELNWKESIVDLLKLLDIDSSRESRNELATELGIPSEMMEDSAKMNIWLHKKVLQEIAANGGNVPKELLD